MILNIMLAEITGKINSASSPPSGAAASFVSEDGPVLTNHHVGAGAIQNLSTRERDLMQTGFYARTRAEELKCPGMEFLALQGIEDVTERVRAAEETGDTDNFTSPRYDLDVAFFRVYENDQPLWTAHFLRCATSATRL
ncbi:MAG: S46 family peptidase [Candidatus Aminicenantales bacterium]